MISFLIDFSLRRPALVAIIAALVTALGFWSATKLPIDAVPDITNPQVQINTPVDALAAEEIESRVTIPIESEMAGLPGLQELRSLSKFGLSQVTMTFRDGVDVLRIRQLVSERLTQARDHLPAEVSPMLGPMSTGLGEIVYYTVHYKSGAPGVPSDKAEQLRQLRSLHDFTIKPLLRSTPGLADVNAIGGFEKQIFVEPDPAKLEQAGVSFTQLVEVLRKSTENAGGGVLELGGEAVVVRADTRAKSVAEIGEIPVKFAGSSPLLVKDLASISIGSVFRSGASTEDGEEAVTGAAIMLAGENARRVAKAVTNRLAEIETKLPEGVEVRVLYDRADLVNATIQTVLKNLGEGAILVAAILFAFLGNWRAALIVTLAIPLSFLVMLTGMVESKISANLMSLGALDFGLIVDGAIVMVENILRRLAEEQRRLGRRLDHAEQWSEVRSAAHEVARPMFFGVLIITLVYVPILALTGVEGKMFRPMAWSVMFALIGALALALTLMPALCALFLRGAVHESEGRLISTLKSVYRPVLEAALRFKVAVGIVAAAIFLFSGWLFSRLGAEFIPQLDEGSLSIQMIRGNSVALTDSMELQRTSERLLLEHFPEISHIFSRVGTSEIATDPMGPNVSDTYVFLKPRDQWRKRDGRPINKAQLSELMRSELIAHVPGQAYLLSQPIQMRFNEIMAGARADLSLKIYGDDYAELERLAMQAREILSTVRGGAEVEFEALGRIPVLEITPKRDALQRLTLQPGEINKVISAALGGESAGTLLEGTRRFDVVVRLPDELRVDLAGIRKLPVISDGGVQVPLERIAQVSVVDRVGTVTRENSQRRVAILIGVRDRDTQGFVDEAMEKLRAKLNVPPGYSYEFGGQFENLQAARARLAVVVPCALGLILLLIYGSFRSVRQSLLVFLCVPLAAAGGVVALSLRGMPFTLSAAIGFIALSGIAVLNGIMLISFINQLRVRGKDVRTAVLEGTLTRLRPKIMTALVASLGFVPMALATGPGAEVQRPLATVVIGGVITSTFLTLILLPVLYDALEGRRGRKAGSARVNSPVSPSRPEPSRY
jgi:heavy metal efflux system protein